MPIDGTPYFVIKYISINYGVRMAKNKNKNIKIANNKGTSIAAAKAAANASKAGGKFDPDVDINRQILDEQDIKPPDTRTPMRRGMDAFGNMFALNVCFVVGCLPVITIGASVTALYSMCIRLQEGKEETILAGFITEYKKNFKQATKAFLVMLVALAVMFAEYVMINNIQNALSTFYTYVLLVEAVLFALVVPFTFPLIACYENTLLNTFKNSFMLALGYLGSWIKVFLAWVAPIALSYMYPVIFLYTWYLWLLLFFGVIAYGSSFTIRKMFDTNRKIEANTKAKALEAAKEEAAREAAKKKQGREKLNSMRDKANAKAKDTNNDEKEDKEES